MQEAHTKYTTVQKGKHAAYIHDVNYHGNETS